VIKAKCCVGEGVGFALEQTLRSPNPDDREAQASPRSCASQSRGVRVSASRSQKFRSFTIPDPIDLRTHRVVSDCANILYDPTGTLEPLLGAVGYSNIETCC
jgi:hypothetical protein